MSGETWFDWCAGIRSNLGKPAFADVWGEIAEEAPGTFEFLERLIASKFNDPAKWQAWFAVLNRDLMFRPQAIQAVVARV